MSPLFIEQLEQRTFLSATVGAESAPVMTAQAVTAAATATAKLRLYVQTYTGSATINGIVGTLNLKITSISGSAVKATLSSTQWGGFSVALTGTVKSATGAVSLTGKNANTNVKAFKCTIASNNKTLTGTIKGTQMGLSASGSFKINRVSIPPVVATVKWPSLVHKYKGSASNGNTVTMSITKQSQGCFWGTSNQGTVTGFVMTNGEFYMMITNSNGYTTVHGTRNSKGVLSGGWQFTGRGGNESGTFKLSPV